MLLKADAVRLPMRDQSVDLCLGSPPYMDARLYLERGVNLGVSRKCDEWIDWMLRVTAECLRVTRGPVIWIASGVTRDRSYQPACEGLMYRWWKEGWSEEGPAIQPSGVWQDGIELHMQVRGKRPAGSQYRPCYWQRVGIPGSGGDQWFRADVEYAMCFKRPGRLPHADPKANGHPPKWAPGGEMSHRLSDGTRRNQWGHGGKGKAGSRKKDGTHQGQERPSHVFDTLESAKRRLERGNENGSCRVRMHTKRNADGEMQDQCYSVPAIANPGNLIMAKVGGGLMGHKLAHENEAPFPVGIPAFFIRSHCPKDGLVLDPFSGSGTTGQAAVQEGRRYVLADLRQSQALLARRRLDGVQRPLFV